MLHNSESQGDTAAQGTGPSSYSGSSRDILREVNVNWGSYELNISNLYFRGKKKMEAQRVSLSYLMLIGVWMTKSYLKYILTEC